jgi:hypothetical protein
MRASYLAHPIFLDLIILYLMMGTSYEAPYYAIFSHLVQFHLSSVQIFSSAF